MGKETTGNNIRVIFKRKGEKQVLEKREFLKNLDELFNMAFEAHSNYEIWWIYVNEIDRAKYLHVLIRYKEFFETMGNANITTIVIALYKLFDKHPKTLNINKIIEDAEKHKFIDSASKTTLNGLINKAKPLWKKITILRSNLYAHRREMLTVKQIYKIAQITPNEIKELMELGLQILNFMRLKMGMKSERKFEDFTSRDTHRVLEALGLIESKKTNG